MGLNMVEDPTNIIGGNSRIRFSENFLYSNLFFNTNIFLISITNFLFYSLDSAFSVGDPVNARDLWLIVELQSDSRGRRTHLGKVGRMIQIFGYHIIRT